MDITRCNTRVRQSSEIGSNFSEQFSDSSSNNGDISRSQHSNRAASSPCEEETAQHFQKAERSPLIMDGDIDTLGNSNGSSTTLKSPTSKNNLSQQVPLSKVKPNINVSSSIRDEKEIKTEETSLSPQNVSPLGIGHSNRDNDNGTPTLTKSSNHSPLPCEKSVPFFRNACNELQERSKSAGLVMPPNNSSNFDGGSTNINTSMSPKSNPEGFGSNASNLTRNLNHFNGNLTKYNCSTQGEFAGSLNTGGGGGGEYMQQQNHVFVFSTQLANKSAEAVVGGQFPTIIAYHCMQPSTKLFLEDFLKNPAKTTKLQRQYSLNIMSLMQSGLNRPSGGQSYWLNECTNSSKFPQRPSGLRNVGGNKNNPGWDPAVLDNQACVSSNSLELLDNADSFDNIQSAVCGIKSEDKSGIPSLQGVKVPDENLTPQQRQHREEQLAKLKKMNKFLFPENDGHDFNSQSNSLANPDAVGNNSSGEMLHNTAGNCSDVNSVPGNSGKQSSSNLDSRRSLGNDTDMMPADIMTTGSESSSMGTIQPNKHGCVSKMNSSNSNVIKSRGQSDEQINAGIDANQDMSSSFNMNSCPSSETETAGGPSNMNMSPEEWSKFQNNSFPDSFKGRHHTNLLHTSCSTAGTTASQQSSSLSRSLSMGVAAYGIQSRPNTGPSPTNRNNNGPPPPYHQTQRSASVPIATQSPTHASPNNATTDMPMTSPQASRVPFSVSSTPSNTDVASSTIISNPTHSSTTSFTGLPSGNPKNIYSRDGSNVCNPTQVYSHSTSILNSLAANPPTSLSHISPRDIDCIDTGHKSKRSSPQQKCKSPLINELQDNNCMEPKYANFGLNFSTCGMPTAANPQNLRHNMQPMPSQFCRRIDNIPLNPNCNRVSQNKPVSNFDPIASLAQMSQQLTGSSGGMGLSTMGSGNSVPAGLMDVNAGELLTGPSGRTGDPILDHCNQMANNNIGVVGLAGALGRVTGQFAPDMNNMNMLCGDSGPIDQRMLNGKLCLPGNYNHNTLTGVGLRDTAVGCNDMSSSNHRAVNRRMPTNFDNFNMSPNIHVKVSAPNTIQYMPARSQNLNNMRMPPSLEFFQRYANPQVMGNMGGNPPGHISNDIGNPNMMNIFGNCGQMPSGVGQLSGRGGSGFEQNDLELEGNLIPNDAYMNVP